MYIVINVFVSAFALFKRRNNIYKRLEDFFTIYAPCSFHLRSLLNIRPNSFAEFTYGRPLPPKILSMSNEWTQTQTVHHKHK